MKKYEGITTIEINENIDLNKVERLSEYMFRLNKEVKNFVEITCGPDQRKVERLLAYKEKLCS